jgi:hypothetical protein
MQPRIWGPPTWRVLHSLAHLAQSSRSHRLIKCFYDLTFQLKDVLPCSLCRESVQGFHARAFALHGRDPMAFMHTLHNMVNDKLGKGPGPSMDTLQATMAVYAYGKQMYASTSDVWIMLFVFGACADALPSHTSECTLRHVAFQDFVNTLSALMAGTRVPEFAAIAAVLQQQFHHRNGYTPLACESLARAAKTTTCADLKRLAKVARVRAPSK